MGLLLKPIKLTDSGRAIAWQESDLIEWRAKRVAARDGVPKKSLSKKASTKKAGKAVR